MPPFPNTQSGARKRHTRRRQSRRGSIRIPGAQPHPTKLVQAAAPVAKAAPFKRNDALLAVLPVGVIVFPGNGIQDNLADKAKALGIPVMRFGKGGV